MIRKKNCQDTVMVFGQIIHLYKYILDTFVPSVYSPFSDRVGLSLHNILSPFLPAKDIFFIDIKFSHIHVNTL